MYRKSIQIEEHTVPLNAENVVRMYVGYSFSESVTGLIITQFHFCLVQLNSQEYHQIHDQLLSEGLGGITFFNIRGIINTMELSLRCKSCENLQSYYLLFRLSSVRRQSTRTYS